MKRYKFQALVTLGERDEPRNPGPADMPGGQLRRVVVHGQHHKTGCTKFFNALVTDSGEGSRWPEEDPVIMTIMLVCDEPREYFDIGDSFSFWLGRDRAHGVVTRRLFV